MRKAHTKGDGKHENGRKSNRVKAGFVKTSDDIRECIPSMQVVQNEIQGDVRNAAASAIASATGLPAGLISGLLGGQNLNQAMQSYAQTELNTRIDFIFCFLQLDSMITTWKTSERNRKKN